MVPGARIKERGAILPEPGRPACDALSAFQATIAQAVALAPLMPTVAGIGGNTGNQTVAPMIRGIALQQITPQYLLRFLTKAPGIGLVNGLTWGCAMALVTQLDYGDASLALVMLIAMVGNFCVAALAVVAVPAALRFVGRDPVLGSSVSFTALTDRYGIPAVSRDRIGHPDVMSRAGGAE